MNSSTGSRKKVKKKMKYTEEQRTKLIEELWATSHKKLINFLYRWPMTSEEREDVVQEAFARAYKSLESFKGDSRMETWLFTIAKNIYLNKIRYNHSRKRDWASFDINRYAASQSFRSSASAVTNSIVQTELDKIVSAVIEFKFKERPQLQLVMREIFINDTDLSQQELAKAYGVTAGAIRREKFKLGKRIQEKLRAMHAI